MLHFSSHKPHRTSNLLTSDPSGSHEIQRETIGHPEVFLQSDTDEVVDISLKVSMAFFDNWCLSIALLLELGASDRCVMVCVWEV